MYEKTGFEKLDEYLYYRPSETNRAKIKIRNNLQGDRVSERLFGLFTEHLGKNVYGGAWAQVFANGGFESFNMIPKEVPEHQRPTLKKNTIKRLQIAAEQFNITDLAKYEELGIAPYWGPINKKANYQLETGFNGTTQKIKSSVKGDVGLETPIYLPLDRVDSYNLQIKVLLSEKSKEHPGRVRFQICQIQGSDGSDNIQEDDYNLAPYGLDYQGETTEKDSIRVLTEEIINLDSVVGIGKWTKLRALLKVRNKDLPAGSRLKFRIIIDQPGTIYFDQAQLFPNDSIEGWDPEVVDLLRQLKVSILRFPGGNFVSGYHWQDGIGPIESRVEKPNPAWPEWESNHVGTDEWLTLCELIGAEPLICVNAGNGSAEEAANWVRYCNDPITTEWGKRRAQNGHAAPYNVRLWEVGNELWGKFQINRATSSEYGDRFTEFANAMKAADSTIDLLAVGGTMPDVVKKNKREEMLGVEYAKFALENNPDQIWALAEHAVMGGAIPNDESSKQTYLELLAQTHHVGEVIEKDLKKLKEMGNKALISQTEQMVAISGEDCPADESLAAAIIWSGFMNWFLRSNGKVVLFTRSAMINHGDLLKKVRGVTYPLPGYWAQYLYANQAGRLPVRVDLETPCLEAGGKYFEAAKNMPGIDTVALVSEDQSKLVLLAVNRDPEQTIITDIVLDNFKADKVAKMEFLAGPSFTARNYWDSSDHVSPISRKIFINNNVCCVSLPPASLAVITFIERRVE